MKVSPYLLNRSRIPVPKPPTKAGKVIVWFCLFFIVFTFIAALIIWLAGF